MLRRWGIYLSEVFQPFSRLLFSFLMTILTWSLVAPPPRPGWPWKEIIVGTLTYALMILYYRISDEFKDADTDQKFFPERPVPSGRVSLTDLQILRTVATFLCLGLAFFTPQSLNPFIAYWLFAWLMGKWFFLPKLIGENRLLAFVTHAPVGIFASFYLISLFLPMGAKLLTPWALGLVLVMNIPGLVWELLRKTRSPMAEVEGYQTYSAMLGVGGALALVGCLLFLSMGLFLWMLPTWPVARWSLWLLLLLHLLMLITLPVLHRALKTKTLELRPLGEVYNGIVLLTLLVASFLGPA